MIHSLPDDLNEEADWIDLIDWDWALALILVFTVPAHQPKGAHSAQTERQE